MNPPTIRFSAILHSPRAPADAAGKSGASRTRSAVAKDRSTPPALRTAAHAGRGSTARSRSNSATWSFLKLPGEASARLPSRGQTTVAGTFNGRPFQATLQPDGHGGHWLKVDRALRESAGASPGDVVALEIAPVVEEPEPKLPADFRKALAAAEAKVRAAWADITPAARRDFVFWITSPKRPETRVKRIATACDMLAKGKRRPCCFDRSGMYAKSLSCPEAEADDA
ncbi:MAG: YdeI/OmpD-associated family protein [Phycisphaerae bacterium]